MDLGSRCKVSTLTQKGLARRSVCAFAVLADFYSMDFSIGTLCRLSADSYFYEYKQQSPLCMPISPHRLIVRVSFHNMSGVEPHNDGFLPSYSRDIRCPHFFNYSSAGIALVQGLTVADDLVTSLTISATIL